MKAKRRAHSKQTQLYVHDKPMTIHMLGVKHSIMLGLTNKIYNDDNNVESDTQGVEFEGGDDEITSRETESSFQYWDSFHLYD